MIPLQETPPRWPVKRYRLLALVAIAAPAIAADVAPIPSPKDRAPEVRLSGETIVMPLVMVREFPFVVGEIAGVKGKLLFDTGALEALVVNDHRIPVVGARSIGTGRFGSGQSYSINLVPAVSGVRVGPLAFPAATSVSTQNALQLETNVTPDFIGWLGYQAFGDYAFKLDYRHSRVTFYKGEAATYLANEKVLGELVFEPRKRPNDPIMSIRIGDLDAEAVFDTGQYGALYVDEPTKARLIKTGHLTPSAKEKDTFDLTGLSAAGRPVASIKRLDVVTQPYGPGKSIGMTGPANMTVGFGFLRHYKTVWDFRTRRIYLLAP